MPAFGLTQPFFEPIKITKMEENKTSERGVVFCGAAKLNGLRERSDGCQIWWKDGAEPYSWQRRHR